MNDIELFNRFEILKNHNNITSDDDVMQRKKKCNKKIIFPYTKDYDSLKIDNKSLYYITTYKIANRITKLTIMMIRNIKLNYKKITLTDCCAGVGGNTISFAKYFKVNAVEINKIRIKYLINNLNIYNLKANIYHDDFVKIHDNIKSDVVFIDPPWGGNDYKNHNKLKLSLSGVNIANFCNILLLKSKMIVLKVPNNFDFDNFNDIVKSNKKIYYFNKMAIIYVSNYFS